MDLAVGDSSCEGTMGFWIQDEVQRQRAFFEYTALARPWELSNDTRADSVHVETYPA
jgi:hypothetical protein